MQMEGLAHQGLLAATQGQVIKLDDDDDDDEDINDIDDTGDLDDVDAIVESTLLMVGLGQKPQTSKALTSSLVLPKAKPTSSLGRDMTSVMEAAMNMICGNSPINLAQYPPGDISAK